MKKGVLLINLGSPDSTDVPDVKKYLREFLMDPLVIDIPYVIRKLVIELAILRLVRQNRPKRINESGGYAVLRSKSFQIDCKERFQKKQIFRLHWGCAIRIHLSNQRCRNCMTRVFGKFWSFRCIRNTR